jgi:hypothetical protein
VFCSVIKIMTAWAAYPPTFRDRSSCIKLKVIQRKRCGGWWRQVGKRVRSAGQKGIERCLPFPPCRGNRLGVKGWAAMSDAIEAITSLTCLNGCDQYAAIRAGGVTEMRLGGTELGVWAARFLERSASTLTSLDIRCCAVVGCQRVGRVPHAKLNFSQAPMAQ